MFEPLETHVLARWGHSDPMSTKRVRVERHAQGAIRRRQLPFRKRISCWKGAIANFRYLQDGELRESHSTCGTLRRQGSGINLAVISETFRYGRWQTRTFVGSSRHSRRLNHFAMIPGSPSWLSIAGWSLYREKRINSAEPAKVFRLKFCFATLPASAPRRPRSTGWLCRVKPALVLAGCCMVTRECGRALRNETISGRNGDQDRSCAPTSGLRSRRAQHLVFSGLQSAA